MGLFDRVKDGVKKGLEAQRERHNVLIMIKNTKNKKKFLGWLAKHKIVYEDTMTWKHILNRLRINPTISNDTLKSYLGKEGAQKIEVAEARKEVKKIRPDRERPVETMKRTKKVTDLDSKFNTIMRRIDKQFDVPAMMNEEQFEKMLWMFLNTSFRTKAYDIKYQVSCKAGKIDIAIDGNDIGLELKIVTKSNLQRLYGQVMQYVKDFSRIGIVLYDIGKMQPSELKSWIKDFNGIPNTKTVVKSGALKNKHKRKQVIYIKK